VAHRGSLAEALRQNRGLGLLGKPTPNTVRGEAHIGKMNWQRAEKESSLDNLTVLFDSMPKIKFAKNKKDQIHANIKKALNEQLVKKS